MIEEAQRTKEIGEVCHFSVIYIGYREEAKNSRCKILA
jgi:hypothetical protein